MPKHYINGKRVSLNMIDDEQFEGESDKKYLIRKNQQIEFNRQLEVIEYKIEQANKNLQFYNELFYKMDKNLLYIYHAGSKYDFNFINIQIENLEKSIRESEYDERKLIDKYYKCV